MPSINIKRKNGDTIECLFDEEDLEFINQFNWSVSTSGYILRTKDKKSMHRLLVNITDPNTRVNHINHDRSDNRRCNLRVVDNSVISQNRSKKSNCSSEYIGVSFDKKKQKWNSTCNTGEGKQAKEFYDIETHAAYAYDLMITERLGSEARINGVPMPDGFIRFSMKYRKSNDRSKYIVLHKKTYMVQIQKKGVTVYNKGFKTEEEAMRHRDQQIDRLNREREAVIKSIPIQRNEHGVAIIKCSPSKKEVVYTMVDDEDYYNILLTARLGTSKTNYVLMGTKRALLHRWLLDRDNDLRGIYIDHIDGNTLNNQKTNLRIANSVVNSRNKRKRTGTSSQYIGISKDREKFISSIGINNKMIYLGSYDTEEHAAAARDCYIKEERLEGFNLNNIDCPEGYVVSNKRLKRV